MRNGWRVSGDTGVLILKQVGVYDDGLDLK